MRISIFTNKFDMPIIARANSNDIEECLLFDAGEYFIYSTTGVPTTDYGFDSSMYKRYIEK